MVKIIADSAEWAALMETSKTKPVVVDFFAECTYDSGISFCEPCSRTAEIWRPA